MTARWQTGTVACGGEEIYYEVSGDDDLPAIMLTHGMGGTHAAWFQQVPTLAANGFRVITWDCRGFGNSTFTSGVHGSAAAVADMAAVLDATGTPGAHLVGQSMGGWWATAFTVAHPARTHSLTLSNTAGGLWTTALLEYVREWTTEYAANFGAEQRIGAHAAISPTFVERDPARAFLYQELDTFHTPPKVGASLTGDAVAHKDLDATGVPVLVITSTDDVQFPPHLVIDSAQLLAVKPHAIRPRDHGLEIGVVPAPHAEEQARGGTLEHVADLRAPVADVDPGGHRAEVRVRLTLSSPALAKR